MIELACTVVIVFGTFSAAVAAESRVEDDATVSTGPKAAITQGVPSSPQKTRAPNFIMTEDGKLKRINVPPPYTAKQNTNRPGVNSSPFQERVVFQTTSSRRRQNSHGGEACFFVFVFLMIMFVAVIVGAAGASKKKKRRGGGLFGGWLGGGGCGGGGGGGCGGGGCGGCGEDSGGG